MKKITLAILAVVSLVSSGFGQATYTLEVPEFDNASSAFRAPNGTSAYASQRSVMFIHQEEMLPMNLATINTVKFQYLNGTGTIPVVGNFTLWLENSTDQDINKPNSFSAIVATMTPNYIGTFTVPGGTGAATITLPLTTNFNYSGGSMYAVWNFQSSGPFAASAATVASNSTTGWLYYNNSSGAAVNTFTSGGIFRPALIFQATNTATNEIEVVRIETPGKAAKTGNVTQNVSVKVVNSSIAAQTNVNITFSASGANAATASSVIANFPPGTFTTITFPYSTPVLGVSTLSAAAVIVDQNLANNLKITTQSVTCSNLALIQPSVPLADYTSNTVGNGIITSFWHLNGPSPTSLTTISVITPSFANAANLGKVIYPVITTTAGVMVATGNSLTLAAANLNVWQPLTFASSPVMAANTPYLLGVGTTATGYFPIGFAPSYNPSGYFTMPIGGGTPAPILYGNLALEATIVSSSTSITAVATKTAVCKASPQQVTLTVTGANTYTWSGSIGTGSTVVFTPTAGPTSSVLAISVTGSYTTGANAGCKSPAAGITFTLLGCTGINDNTGADAIRIFPNPAVAGKVTISNLAGSNLITVYNTLGQTVLTSKTENDTEILDMSSFPSGNYLVKITDANNESRLLKLVTQN